MKSESKSHKRPKHKETLRLNELAEALAKKHPEPMTLMHKREKGVDQGLYDPIPALATQGLIDKTATAVSEWENSDPFSYDRTALYVKKGLLDPKKLIEEMQQRTMARRVARRREVERLQK